MNSDEIYRNLFKDFMVERTRLLSSSVTTLTVITKASIHLIFYLLKNF
jgi:hypothetical protein